MKDAITGFFGEYRFLSNFFPVPVTYKGRTWKTSEHAYQAAKFTDKNIVEEIFKALKPGDTKRLAKKYKSEIREDWEDVKLDVMYEIVKSKFFGDLDCASKLIDTGDMYIEETNTWNDRFWGVCDGSGSNYLGQILMLVRKELNEL